VAGGDAVLAVAAFIEVCAVDAGTTGCAVIGWDGIMFSVLPVGAAADGAGGGAVVPSCLEQAPNTPATASNAAVTRKRFMSETSCH